ncbi:MAG TPA: hypothetical protein PKE64_19925 [Anaerolineae bacterium]|nr:hypothetical protein [Anaerolineae bacterium]HMR66287.1 hypothetical protein [Anaerolineae bacterium]
MTTQIPRITSLKPIVLPDQKRVMMEMVVEDLPSLIANVSLDLPGPTDPASSPGSSPPPYPNIELSILDSQGRTVATALIVEHQEPFTNLTLHLRQPDVNENYTARAELTYQEQSLQLVEVPFTLDKPQP